MNLVYDVAHNIAKFEEHDGRRQAQEASGSTARERRGRSRRATRRCRRCTSKIGQPVIIPGDMGRASWVLVGQPGSMEQTFGTTCHGAGRAMSRTAAVKDAAGRRIDKELEARGVIARAAEPPRAGGGAAQRLQERR